MTIAKCCATVVVSHSAPPPKFRPSASVPYERMFHSSAKRLRALLSLADDILGDPEPETPHPHRRPVRIERKRRPGSVAAPPAHCLSPVRSNSRHARRESVR